MNLKRENSVADQQSLGKVPRLAGVDLARSASLLCMVIFHLAYDLQFFGILPAGTTSSGGWAIFSRLIAASFLFLAGFSLYLAHGDQLRPTQFLKRLAIIAGAAALVSCATYFAFPNQMIFFGILHSIALSSFVGVLFLRLPVILIVVSALFVLVTPEVFRSEFFDHPPLIWLGLSTVTPASLDFEPVFPWFAAFLFGLASAKEFSRRGLLLRSKKSKQPNRLTQIATWPGRYSLTVYLLHQPVLLALLWSAITVKNLVPL